MSQILLTIIKLKLEMQSFPRMIASWLPHRITLMYEIFVTEILLSVLKVKVAMYIQ